MPYLTTATNEINMNPKFLLILLIAAAIVFIGNLIIKAIKKDRTAKAIAALFPRRQACSLQRDERSFSFKKRGHGRSGAFLRRPRPLYGMGGA